MSKAWPGLPAQSLGQGAGAVWAVRGGPEQEGRNLRSRGRGRAGPGAESPVGAVSAVRGELGRGAASAARGEPGQWAASAGRGDLGRGGPRRGEPGRGSFSASPESRGLWGGAISAVARQPGRGAPLAARGDLVRGSFSAAPGKPGHGAGGDLGCGWTVWSGGGLCRAGEPWRGESRGGVRSPLRRSWRLGPAGGLLWTALSRLPRLLRGARLPEAWPEVAAGGSVPAWRPQGEGGPGAGAGAGGPPAPTRDLCPRTTS